MNLTNRGLVMERTGEKNQCPNWGYGHGQPLPFLTALTRDWGEAASNGDTKSYVLRAMPSTTAAKATPCAVTGGAAAAYACSAGCRWGLRLRRSCLVSSMLVNCGSTCSELRMKLSLELLNHGFQLFGHLLLHLLLYQAELEGLVFVVLPGAVVGMHRGRRIQNTSTCKMRGTWSQGEFFFRDLPLAIIVSFDGA